MDLEVNPSLTIPAAELHWKFSRSSGPGGQHVNTSDSRVQLTWSVADSLVLTDELRAVLLDRIGPSTTVTVSEERSQLRNRDTALANLASRLRDALTTYTAALTEQALPVPYSVRDELWLLQHVPW